ncbi:MAG: 2-oxoacid:acceptor oxidoreductase family protein [Myxococcales bacterium]|jgi:2-oxoglutarate ferredoxin oxidoreductase subunit gamma|nr:2-oxoacid:acceptor oxidoreductase family protein [Myxococcales bacterium]
MAQTSIVMAGFGGQGVMSIGKILAKAAIHEGKEVTWLPSYGPEMRGGTANCTVVIADDPIGSPLVKFPDAALVMNKQSLDKFEEELRPSGLIAVNTALIDRAVKRGDLCALYVDANALAERGGAARSANLALLGAFMARCDVLPICAVEAAIEETFAGKSTSVLETSLAIFRAGVEAAATG